MSLSIRWRLAAGIVLAFAATLAIVFLTLHLSLGRVLTADLDAGLSRDVERTLAQVAVVGSLDDPEKLQQEVVDRNSTPGSAFITVIRDADGNVLASTPGVDAGALALSGDEMSDVLAGDSFSRDVDLAGGEEFRVRTAPLSIAGEVVGVMQAGETTAVASRPVDRLEVILIAEAVAGVALALGIGYWLSRGALKPLEDVADAAAEIEASDLHRRIAVKGRPAEVQKLADTFDSMLARLDKAFEEQKTFVLDVSHELRTPLTALRGNIDVMLMDQRLDAETRGELERMSAEVARLIRLTSNLLYLASADAGRQPERRPVELDVLCLEVYRQGHNVRPDVKLSLGREDQVTVIGDRDLLKQMILNLVDNGMKYTQAGGRVELSLARDGGWAQLTVEDSGPGIPPENLPHIFERFYRGEDRARRGGAGLGLAIADWIVRAHSGRIEVDSEVGRGSTFTVSLPISGDGSDAPAAATGEERADKEPPASEPSPSSSLG